MPRTSRHVIAKLKANQLLPEPRKEDKSAAGYLENAQQEFEERGHQPGEMLDQAVSFLRRAGRTLPTETTYPDQGNWLEMWWRVQVREQGKAHYQEAQIFRSFRDTAAAPESASPLMKRRQEDLSEAEANKQINEVWGGVPQQERANSVVRYFHILTNIRPHGFESIGRVERDSPLGRTLIHGVQLFLATSCDPSLSLAIHRRHARATAIDHPLLELFKYQVFYGSDGSDRSSPSTFTQALPPASAQVPVFDHLCLQLQIRYIAAALDIVMPVKSSPNCPCTSCVGFNDNVYNWAAFNKLLLLGLLAPVEEAYAGEQTPPVIHHQSQLIMEARSAEVNSAHQDLQATLGSFRCLLHEQVQAEMHVGQAVLQFVAAHQQQQQQPSGLLEELKQQLQSCHLSDLWSSYPTTSNSGSSSSSGDSSSSSHLEQQLQQLLLLVCAGLAWPLAALDNIIDRQEDVDKVFGPLQPQPQQQPQQRPQQGLSGQDLGQQGQQANPAREAFSADGCCSEQLQRMLQAILHAPAAAGMAAAGSAGEATSAHKLLLDGLLSVLLDLAKLGEQPPTTAACTATCANGKQGGSPPAGANGAASSSRSSSSISSISSCGDTCSFQMAEPAAAAAGPEDSPVDSPAAGNSTNSSGSGAVPNPNAALKLQALVRWTCHMLLVKLFSCAPPCEAWSWELCVKALQLLLAGERVVAAAGDLLHAHWSCVVHAQGVAAIRERLAWIQQLKQKVMEQQQQEGHELTGLSNSSSSSSSGDSEFGNGCQCIDCLGQEHHIMVNDAFGRMRKAAVNVVSKLLELLQSQRQLDEAFQGCLKQQEQQHEPTPTVMTAKQRSSRRADSNSSSRVKRLKQQQQQQQQLVEDMSQPTFWREQLLAQYKSSRPQGFSWMQRHFDDAVPDNDKAGFWGLMRGFAYTDLLNLRQREAPGAAAVAAPSVLPMYRDNTSAQEELRSQAMLSRQLARMANLLESTSVSLSSGTPLGQQAVAQMLRLACIAAQQPWLLAYAKPRSEAMRAAAAAAGRQVGPSPDADGDVFLTPCTSPEPPNAASNGQQGSAAAAAAGGGGGASKQRFLAAAAAIRDAGRGWEQSPVALSLFANLAPLFEASQQGPCLVRLTQLLLQYHSDTAAVAAAQLQRFKPELVRQQLWVPGDSTSRNSQYRSSNNSGSCYGSLALGSVPADRSRLFVLLMGVYHLEMYNLQQDRQQQHEQQRQHSNSTTGSGAAASDDVYSSLETQLQQLDRAVQTAHCDMQDVLMYCLQPVEEAAAKAVGHAPSGSSTQPFKASSSSYNSSSGSRQPRFEVCQMTSALMRDGWELASHTSRMAGYAAWEQAGQPAGQQTWPPQGTLCDSCTAKCATSTSTDGPAARATVACHSCRGIAWFCPSCATDSEVQQQHGKYCSAAGAALQQAHFSIFRATSQVPDGVTAANSMQFLPCLCAFCAQSYGNLDQSLQARWHCCPMVQLTGPWLVKQQQEQQQQQQKQEQEQEQEQEQHQQQQRRQQPPGWMQAVSGHVPNHISTSSQQAASVRFFNFHEPLREVAWSWTHSLTTETDDMLDGFSSSRDGSFPGGGSSYSSNSYSTRRREQQQQQQQRQTGYGPFGPSRRGKFRFDELQTGLGLSGLSALPGLPSFEFFGGN